MKKSTYDLTVKSDNKTATGMRMRPSQNTGELNNIWSLPTMTAPTFMIGQKLLKINLKINYQFQIMIK